MEAVELARKIESWRTRLEINRYNLADACVKQPAFYAEVAKELPLFAKLKKIAKGEFEFTKSDLELRIRRDPQAFDLEKATDKAVAAAVVVQDEYQTTQQRYFDAEQVEHDLIVIVEAVSDRKSMIRDLVELYSKDYFQNQDMQTMDTPKAVVDDQADALKKFRSGRRRERNRKDNEEDKHE
jgi:hypothetical protein